MKRGLVFGIVLGLVLINLSFVSADIPVSSCQNLQDINNNLGEDYYLTQDIDCSGFGTFEDIGGWSDPFLGRFDGRGFKIIMTGVSFESWTQGLFSELGVGGEIKNVGLINISLSAVGNDVGCLVGVNKGEISKSYVFCSLIDVFSNHIGGLVHENYGTIKDCYVGGTIIGSTLIRSGGLVAENSGGDIINSYSIAQVTDSRAFVGSFFPSSTCSGCFWDFETSGSGSSGSTECDGGATAKTTAEMKTEATFTSAGWDFDNNWAIDPTINDGYPYIKICSPEDIIMKLYQPTNTHGALWNDPSGDYDIDICYSDYFGTYTGDTATVHDCSDKDQFLFLNSSYNSHVSSTQDGTYSIPICYGDLQCSVMLDPEGDDCDGEIIASLNGTTNAHISKGDFSGYDYKVCCGGSTGGVYWADMNGNPITEAEIEDTVLLIYEDMAGMDYDFEIKEDGSTIKTITDTFDYGTHLAVKWKINQDNIDEAQRWWEFWEGDTVEFKFEVNGEESDILSVDEGSYNNSKPFVNIISPSAESIYVIDENTGFTGDIPFDQNSGDEDDDLKLTWDFADGNITVFENIVETGEGDTAHRYDINSLGTKRINVRVNEMTRSQWDDDQSRIYIYGEGIFVLAIVDEPPYNKTIDGTLVYVNANRSRAIECNYVNATCNANAANKGISGNPCEEVIGELGNSIYCYSLESMRDVGHDLIFEWTFDAGTDNEKLLVGNWTDANYRTYVEFLHGFRDTGLHTLDLRVGYAV